MPCRLGEHRRCHSDRRRAAADEDRFAGLRVEPDPERAARRLQHLRHDPQDRPIEIAGEADYLPGRDRRVLRVSTVKGSAHAAHHRDHALADLELPARAGSDRAGRFDAEDPRNLHAIGEPEPGVELRAVQTEGPRPRSAPDRVRPSAQVSPASACSASGGPGASSTIARSISVIPRSLLAVGLLRTLRGGVISG